MNTYKQQIKYLDKSEIDLIIKKIKLKKINDYRDRALVLTLFSTGLRISECLALGVNLFYKNVYETSIIGKGGYQRVIYFSPAALKAIKEYLDVRKENTNLFPITSRMAQYIIKKRCAKANFVGRPHMFRHSFAMYLLKQGQPIHYVQQFLGHRSLASTAHYLHASNAELTEIHKKLFNK